MYSIFAGEGKNSQFVYKEVVTFCEQKTHISLQMIKIQLNLIDIPELWPKASDD